MKRCYKCNCENDDSSIFCIACGNKFDNANLSHCLSEGTVLKGRYTIREVIGEGGFGITYVGFDQTLNIKVAIKEYYPAGVVNRNNTVSAEVFSITNDDAKKSYAKGKERFLSEARILAQFSKDPVIVNVKDFFEENNTAYIVMEFINGETLKERLKINGTLSPEYTVKMLIPLMQSLSIIHKDGLIHRDISPDNIMFSGDRIVLIDFGAARNVSSYENKSLSVMLKPGYAPEEQYRSKGEQGAWTDVYALSATMYKCITGITPDDATQRVFEDELKSISQQGIIIDPLLEKIIFKGLSVYKIDRYENFDDMLSELSQVSGFEQSCIVHEVTDQIIHDNYDQSELIKINEENYTETNQVEKTVGMMDKHNSAQQDEKTVGMFDKHSSISQETNPTNIVVQKKYAIGIVLCLAISAVGLFVFKFGVNNNIKNTEGSEKTESSIVYTSDSDDVIITSSSLVDLESSEYYDNEDVLSNDNEKDEGDIVITLENGENYKIGKYVPLNYFDYNKLIKSEQEIKDIANLELKTESNYSDKSLSDISVGDEILISQYEADDSSVNTIRNLLTDCGFPLMSSTLKKDTDNNDVCHSSIYYSGDNDEPLPGYGIFFYQEQYDLENYSNNVSCTYRSDCFDVGSTSDVIEYDIQSETEDSSQRAGSWSFTDFNGSVSYQTTNLGIYTNSSGIVFVIAKEDVIFDENEKKSASFTKTYKAYAVANRSKHSISVRNLSYGDAVTTPNSLEMITFDEFKMILDSFSL